MARLAALLITRYLLWERPKGATMFTDRYGLPLSTGSARAAELYVEGIDRTLASGPGPDRLLEEAIAADEGFALAQVALARGEQFRGLIPQARARAARARDLVAGA